MEMKRRDVRILPCVLISTCVTNCLFHMSTQLEQLDIIYCVALKLVSSTVYIRTELRENS